MSSTPRFALNLTRAAIKDAARVVLSVAQWVILDPSLCRALGHTPQALYDDEHTHVIVLCVRCQKVLDDAR